VGQVGLGVAGLQPAGLLYGWTVGRLAGTVRLGRLVHHHGAFARMSRTGIREVAGRFRRFPILSAPAALLNGASLQLPGVLLATAYDARAAGLYLLATRCTSIPMTVFGQSLSQAFMGRLSPAAAGPGSDVAPRVARRTVSRLFWFAAVPCVAIVVLAPAVFPVVFGAEWRGAGRFAQILAPAALVQFAVSPVAWMITLHNRQGWLLGWEVSRLSLVVAALLVPAALGAGASVAVGSYSAVLAVTYVVLLVMVLRLEARPVDTPSVGSDLDLVRSG